MVIPSSIPYRSRERATPYAGIYAAAASGNRQSRGDGPLSGVEPKPDLQRR
jgi:hypothetical protein